MAEYPEGLLAIASSISQVIPRAMRLARNAATISDIFRAMIASRTSAGVVIVLQSCAEVTFTTFDSGRQFRYGERLTARASPFFSAPRSLPPAAA